MIISRVFHKNQVIPERPHIPMGPRKVVNWSWVILVGKQFFKNQWQKYRATWGIQCPLAEINGKINKWIAWWKGTGERKPAERLWRRPLINELSAQRKFKKFCCGKCSSLALLIKVGVFQELITSALQKEFVELQKAVVQTSTGCRCKRGNSRRN